MIEEMIRTSAETSELQARLADGHNSVKRMASQIADLTTEN